MKTAMLTLALVKRKAVASILPAPLFKNARTFFRLEKFDKLLGDGFCGTLRS